jgi:hypothetical protein
MLFMTLVGMLLAVYKFSKDPDEKMKTRQDVFETRCGLQHSNIDKVIENFHQDITLIKENHLRHIEQDISNIKGDLKEIKGALKYLTKK